MNPDGYEVDGKNEVKLTFTVKTHGSVSAIKIESGADKLNLNSKTLLFKRRNER